MKRLHTLIKRLHTLIKRVHTNTCRRQLLLNGASQDLIDNLSAWFAIDGRVGTEVLIGSSGMCPACRTRLKAIDLKDTEMVLLREQLEEAVRKQLDGMEHALGTEENIFTEGTHQGLRGTNHLSHFKEFLEDRGGFDFVVDGANVGFYNQMTTKPGSRIRFKYTQIHHLVQHLSTMGSVLLVMHEQYVSNCVLTKMDRDFINAWVKDDIMYVTPHGMNDDWFWLLAGLTSTRSGKRPYVITNDHMKDHLVMLGCVKCVYIWKFCICKYGICISRPSERPSCHAHIGKCGIYIIYMHAVRGKFDSSLMCWRFSL
jgi:hypothetical protein